MCAAATLLQFIATAKGGLVDRERPLAYAALSPLVGNS